MPSAPNDTPVGLRDGVSARRERLWGFTGGILGALVGVGSAAVAVFIEGADPFQSTPYPAFFAKRQLLSYDLFLAGVVAADAFFGIAGVVLARRSRFPRTDAFGATLVATVLLVLGGALIFTRLVAVIGGS